MRAFTHSLFDRFSGGSWQSVALIAGVVLLLAGVATAKFGLFRGGPTIRADEPHTLSPPSHTEDSPTPAPLPTVENATALPISRSESSNNTAGFRNALANRAVRLPEGQPTLAVSQGEPRVAETMWNEDAAPLPFDASGSPPPDAPAVSPETPWATPAPQLPRVPQGNESEVPPVTKPRQLSINTASSTNEKVPEISATESGITGESTIMEENAGQTSSPERPQVPTPAPPLPAAKVPESAAVVAQPEPSSADPRSSGQTIAPTPNPFDSLPPPSVIPGTAVGPGSAVVPPPATRAIADPPAPISAGTVGSASPLASADVTGFGAEGDARPGDPSLEGPQTPQITIQKILPEEVQVGKPAIFRMVVRNSGAITIPKAEIHDPIPWGIRVLRTNPSAAQGSQGTLVWTVGPLKPGDETVLEIEVMPLQEGEIGSVTTVLLHAQASARTKCTRPQLVVKTQVPPQVMLNDQVPVTITVSNTGSGVATNVVLEEHVPPELRHPAGNELENALGDLKPRESRQVQLKLEAVRAGNAVNRLIARADGNLRVEDQATIQVLAPQIEVTVDGPSRRFLDREAIYQIAITNRGTAPAKNVRLTASLPAGLQFLRANNAGSYDPTTHSAQWLLAELPVGRTGTVELAVNPIAAGEQELVCGVQDDLGLTSEKRLTVLVEGISALHFQVADTKDPIAVAMETTYEIRVVNQGTKEATNVQVMAVFPEGIQPLAGEGPVPHTVNGNEVLFGKLNRLAPKAEAIFRIRCRASSPGDQRVRVQILSDDIRLPITKEESTQVYSDSE
ncbi:MAG: hypothetical protein ACUVQG_10650 [Thermogutta sp.]